MNRLFCVAVFSALVLSARSASAEVDLRGLDQTPEPPITDAQLAPFLGDGPATISGRVFARLPGVNTEYYINTPVYLWPAVPYANWLVDDNIRESVGAFHLAPSDRAIHQFDSAMRTTKTDAKGNFSFAHVPAQPYVVFVAAQDTAERTETLYRTETETVPVYEGEDRGTVYELHENEVPYTSEYTCHTYGWLYGAVSGVAGEDVLTSMSMMYSKNDGC